MKKFRKLFKNTIKAILPYGIVQVYTKKDRGPFQKEFATKSPMLQDSGRFACNWEDRWPCLDEATTSTGFDAHYLYHTAWAARILAETKPDMHVDIGSCLRFATLVSAFVPVQYYDYRPAEITLSNLISGHADITQLPFEDNSINSLSCMHVVEHIGLERYGDPFDPQGDLKAMAELQRVLAPGGNLLFVVPLGEKARIQYNAHRIYTQSHILSAFPNLRLRSFTLVTDSGKFTTRAQANDITGQLYSCGCFDLIKQT